MKKTLITYGIAGGTLALVAAALFVSGVNIKNEGLLFLAPIVLIILTVAYFVDSFGMLCMLLAVLPFARGILQIEIGVITFNPYTIGILVLFVFSVAKLALGKIRYKITPEDWLIALLSVTFLISTLNAKDIVDAGFLAFHAIFIPVITYFVIKTTIYKEEQYDQALVFFVAGIVAFAFFALYDFYLDPRRLKIFNQSSISAAAMFSVAIMVVLFSGRWRSIIGLILLLVLIPALLTTFARGFLVLVFVSPFIYLIIRRGKGFLLLLAMMTMSLIGTLMLASISELPDSLKGQGRMKDQQTAERMTDITQWVYTIYGRGVHYKEGLEQFSRSPIFGNGFHQGSDRRGVRAIVWHNFHIEWLEYGGLVGYILYAMLLLMHYFRYYKYAVHDKYYAMNLTIVLVLLTNGLTNSFTAGITPYLGFLFLAMSNTRVTFSKS